MPIPTSEGTHSSGNVVAELLVGQVRAGCLIAVATQYHHGAIWEIAVFEDSGIAGPPSINEDTLIRPRVNDLVDNSHKDPYPGRNDDREQDGDWQVARGGPLFRGRQPTAIFQ